MSEDANGSGAGDMHAEETAAVFLREIRERLDDASDVSLARRLAPAVSRLTDRLVVVACDRLGRGDMAGFFEAMLEGMTEAQRSAWRREVTEGWFQAAECRWQERQDLRREVLETILFVKALALS